MSKKLDIISPKVVQLVIESQEAESSMYPNPYVGWMTFVLTDDLPNGNKHRILQEEFDNLIKSGINMPIKVAGGTIRPGHEESFPIGVITDLVKENNAIIGTAALWKQEREDDYTMIKNLFESGTPLNISWELRYDKAVEDEESGVTDLFGVSLTAATLVGIPAYKGRTRVLALASSKLTDKYLSKLPDSSFLHVDSDGNRYFPYKDAEENVDVELVTECLNILNADDSEESFPKDLQDKLVASAESIIKNYTDKKEEALEELEKIKADYTELENKFKTLESSLKEKEEALEASASEMTELKEFKEEVEKKEAEEANFAEIKEKFASAGLKLEDDYFETRKETLLSLTEDSLDFFIKELKSLSEGNRANSSQLPRLVADNDDEIKSPAQIARALREKKSK